MSKKSVIFCVACMSGGGADRVASLLSNSFYDNNYDVKMIITSMPEEKMLNTDLYPEIPMIFLQDEIKDKIYNKKIYYKALSYYTRFMCGIKDSLHKAISADLAYKSFIWQYYKEINQLREYLKADPEATVIAFLQPTIPILMLASAGLPNRVIFSERGNPERLMSHRYGTNFIEKYYRRADYAVFQTKYAQSVYPDFIEEKSVVISNPLKTGLPDAYFGERNKNITTFCRISKQKNLPLLLSAFKLVHTKHPDYTLRIIGDCLNEEGEAVKAELDSYIADNGLSSSVEFIPFRKDVHEFILKDALYVNSSDYEGISNAMLEAMAIGIPVVCTDCPVGGAAQTINNGVNGLLVPCNDENALADSICRIIEDESLAASLSQNAALIREELSLEKISQKWMELL